MKTFVRLVTIIALFCSTAHAAPQVSRNMTYIRVGGWRAASNELVERIISASLAKMTEVGFRARKVNVLDLPEAPCADTIDVLSPAANFRVFNCYKDLLAAANARGLYYVILPPTLQHNSSWLWGLGDICTLTKPFGLSIGAATDRRYLTEEDRTWPSIIISQHETLHPLGAKTTYGGPQDGIMWFGAAQEALSQPNVEQPISELSRRQIRTCIRKARRIRFSNRNK